jgi:hypothetical protein
MKWILGVPEFQMAKKSAEEVKCGLILLLSQADAYCTDREIKQKL